MREWQEFYPQERPPFATARPLKGMFQTSLRQRSAAKSCTSFASAPLSQNAPTSRRVRGNAERSKLPLKAFRARNDQRKEASRGERLASIRHQIASARAGKALACELCFLENAFLGRTGNQTGSF